MHENISQFPIIGHEQETFCILVQPANRVNAFRYFFKIVHDRFPALVVTGGCNDALGLIKKKIPFLFGFQPFTVDEDHVLIQIYFRP